LLAELEQLRAGNAKAKEELLQTDRVRESELALEAERDRALAELERVEAIASEAQAIAEEQTRLLAEQRQRHDEERESLVAQRKVLEQKLDDALERLAAAAAVADERGKELQMAAERLHLVLEEEESGTAPTGGQKLAEVRRRLVAKLAAPENQDEVTDRPSAPVSRVEAGAADTETEAFEREATAGVTDLKDGAESADNPTTYPNWRPVMDEYFENDTVFDETFSEPNGTSAALQSLEDEALGAPAWGRSLDRVLGLFDSETTRLHELRGKLTGLGKEMAAREARVKELEAEIQRFQIERLRDQEIVDRLKHELTERNSRLERALANTQELATIIQGGKVR
jgi:hypothetical protein